ncbi:PqqD family protein [Desulfovibrio sp. JC010]|uniref:PqqD family protein n=1 Tax=Desulfovibrio sp. JC010 TaxID=2593641 RepID=UPI0013D7C6D8|nr:PqqD family protein [Desulfovibrio sp. JC010]NDV27299.1 PqqD family protein [Desulfovibrio sp. JC010]
MKLFSKKKQIIPEMTRGEAMACKPVKNRDITETRMDNGLIMLSYPLRLKPLFADVAKRFGMWKDGSPPIKRLELDEMGTLVWDMIDGKNSVRKIAAKFAEKYQVLPREAEVAAASFLRDLGKRGLIAFNAANHGSK